MTNDDMVGFSADVSEVVNRHSMENPSGTPDFILGDFLTSVLASYNDAIQKRAEWRGETVELPALERLVSAVQKEAEKSHFQRVLDDIVAEQVKYRQDYANFLMSNPGFLSTFGEDFVMVQGPMNLSQTDKGKYDELNEYRVKFSQEVRFYRREVWEKIQSGNRIGLSEEILDLRDRLRVARLQGDETIARALEKDLAARADDLKDLGLRMDSNGDLEAV